LVQNAATSQITANKIQQSLMILRARGYKLTVEKLSPGNGKCESRVLNLRDMKRRSDSQPKETLRIELLCGY
jgi:hypothetical protein